MDVAVIPARGGSKRIPRKNIKKFAGQPMITYAIEIAQNARCFDKIIVSSDSEEIIEISKKAGAEVLFKRPASLSDDHTPTVPVIRHAIEKLAALNLQASLVCCLYPTAPFVQTANLNEAMEIVKNNPKNFCFPLCEFPSPIQRSLTLNENMESEPFFSENELVRTQDLKKAYFDAGQFYVGHADLWKACNQLHSNAVCIEIPYWRAVDIDTIEDWTRAEKLYRIR